MSVEQIRPMLRRTGKKIAAQALKDYIRWPLLAVLLTLPFALAGSGPSLLGVFLWLFAANAVACLLRKLWTCLIIFCGHFPAGVHVFTKQQLENETRAAWYVRQLLASCDIRSGRLFHVRGGAPGRTMRGMGAAAGDLRQERGDHRAFLRRARRRVQRPVRRRPRDRFLRAGGEELRHTGGLRLPVGDRDRACHHR